MQKYEAIQKLSPIEFRRLIGHGQGDGQGDGERGRGRARECVRLCKMSNVSSCGLSLLSSILSKNKFPERKYSVEIKQLFCNKRSSIDEIWGISNSLKKVLLRTHLCIEPINIAIA